MTDGQSFDDQDLDAELVSGMTVPEPTPGMAGALAAAESWIGPGIFGVGEGLDEEGQPAIVVLASTLTGDVRDRVPAEHHGFPVVVVTTAPIRAEDQ